ncbi:MAG: hypothetical protein V9H26_13690 [Verrucomicrobiota bacterium]
MLQSAGRFGKECCRLTVHVGIAFLVEIWINLERASGCGIRHCLLEKCAAGQQEAKEHHLTEFATWALVDKGDDESQGLGEDGTAGGGRDCLHVHGYIQNPTFELWQTDAMTVACFVPAQLTFNHRFGDGSTWVSPLWLGFARICSGRP